MKTSKLLLFSIIFLGITGPLTFMFFNLALSTGNIIFYKKEYASFLDNLTKKDEIKILDNFKKQEYYWNLGDLDGFMKAYSKVDTIQTISSIGVTYSYNNILNNYKTYFPEEKMGTLSYTNLSLKRLSNKLYFVTGEFNLKFLNQKVKYGWFSAVLKKYKNDWYIIADHSS